MFLYIDNPFKWKYQLPINRREKKGIKYLKGSKSLIDFSQKINDFFKTLEDYNTTKKGKMLTVFDGMIEDTEANQKLSVIVN